jgi:hypothetical protein
MLRLFIDPEYEAADGPAVFTDPVGNAAVDAVFDCLTGDDLAVFFKVIVPYSEFFHRPVFEGTLVVKDEGLPIVCRESCKGDNCHVAFLLNNIIARQQKDAVKHPIVPSSLDILSNRRPAKLMLYDPLRYGVLSSDDRYLIAPAIIAQIGRKSKRKRENPRKLMVFEGFGLVLLF